MAIPLRVFRDFRRGHLDAHRWSLLIGLCSLAASEDYSLGTPIAYRLSTLANELEYGFSEDKLRKDLRWLADDGYLELVPGAKQRPWQITITEKARLRPILRQNSPPLSGQVEHDSQTIPGQSDEADGQKAASPNGPDGPANPDDSQTIPGRFPPPPAKPEPEEIKDKPEPEETAVPAHTNGNAGNGRLDVHTELQLAELLAWIGNDADTRTHAVLRHNWTQAPEAAQVATRDSMQRAQPRHRAKWLIGTIKAETARAKSTT